jgi:bifunctional DNase/RNase
MIQMSVAGLALDPRNSQPIVILNDDTNHLALPIWIGAMEARAISLALEHAKVQRPMTHDLLLNTILELGYLITQVEIDFAQSDTYFATIKLRKLGTDKSVPENKSIDARPSDAIALALAADAPIFASPKVVEEGGVFVTTPDDEIENEKFKDFVHGVNASDFKIPGLSVRAPEDDETESKQGDGPSTPEDPSKD